MVLIIVTTFLLVITVSIMHAEPRASTVIFRLSAGLNPNKTASFVIVTKVSCEQLGIVSYSLYKSDGNLVKAETINDYGNGTRHSTSVNLANYIRAGDCCIGFGNNDPAFCCYCRFCCHLFL